MKFFVQSICLGIVAMIGCGPQGGVITGNGFQAKSVFHTSEAVLSDMEQKITIVGVAGALRVPGGDLSAKNENTGTVTNVQTALEDGSFLLVLNAQKDDTITLRYEIDAEISELPITLTDTLDRVPAPALKPDVQIPLLQSPEPGIVVVNISSLVPNPLSTSYLVFNADNGASIQSSSSNNDAPEIEAQDGDTICVFAVSPDGLMSTSLCDAAPGSGVNASPALVAGTVSGFTSDESVISFSDSKPFISQPVVIASIASFEEADTVAVRVSGVDLETQSMTARAEEVDRLSEHTGELVSFLAMPEGLIFDSANQIIGEAGNFAMGQPDRDTWHTISFARRYNKPIVFAQTVTTNGSQANHVRVRNVDATSAEIQIEEWLYLDGSHWVEDISYVVLETGEHQIGEYSVEVGDIDGVLSEDEVWHTVSFATPFNSMAAILSQTQTWNEDEPVVTRQQNGTVSGFDVRLQEAENSGADTHSSEQIGFIAIGR